MSWPRNSRRAILLERRVNRGSESMDAIEKLGDVVSRKKLAGRRWPGEETAERRHNDERRDSGMGGTRFRLKRPGDRQRSSSALVFAYHQLTVRVDAADARTWG